MTDSKKNITLPTGKQAIDAFVKKVRSMPTVKAAGDRGRLIFAMDATASREPTWDQACKIQGDMFSTTAELGGLDVQLCYYRGYDEFHSSGWLASARDLLKQMTAVSCRGGYTQIGKVLQHTIHLTKDKKVQALVFVGDCVEEDVDRLCHLAGKLGILGVRVFIFHEGTDATAQRAFQHITRLTRGAYSRFDANSAAQLRDLLSAVAVYAAGGQKALRDFGKDRGEIIKRLTRQLDED